ncbi:MAG: hypothetical protein AB7E81_14405 [Hyphomicrobiaceae bacterium]
MFPRASWPLAALTFVIVSIGTALPSVAAVTLVNRDEKDHKLTVIEDNGAKTTEHMLKPSQVLEGICEKGCVIRLNDSEEDEYELEPTDKVSIEEGYLYYDEPAGKDQGTGGAGQPQPNPPVGQPPAQSPAPDTAPKKQ